MEGMSVCKVHPAFLQGNAGVHTWIFSAFAELIDNSYDANASEMKIDLDHIGDIPCLTFLDTGEGLNISKLHNMLSFGFSDKDPENFTAIGQYGNGFKSSSMRIADDAIVFTRCKTSASVGFLSQTFLKAIGEDSIKIPLLEYQLPEMVLKTQTSNYNLSAILEHSVFKKEEELKAQLNLLSASVTGTKIILFNLKKLDDGRLELDFGSDPSDIRCVENYGTDTVETMYRPVAQETSEYKRSLREYCVILYLKPRMIFTIRGKRVRTKIGLSSKSLSKTETDTYKPSWLGPRAQPIKITFGFNCDRKDDYGIMMYHENRLIKPFERVGYQKQPNELGIGVVGVAQVDFLKPIHNKQDFNKEDGRFNTVVTALGRKLNKYWDKKMNSGNSQETDGELPVWTWVQCDLCFKWRRLPGVEDRKSLTPKWYCRYNPDRTYSRCDVPEEPEEEDALVSSTYKKKQRERKRLRNQEEKLELTEAQETLEMSQKRKRQGSGVKNTLQKKAKVIAVNDDEMSKEDQPSTSSCNTPTSPQSSGNVRDQMIRRSSRNSAEKASSHVISKEFCVKQETEEVGDVHTDDTRAREIERPPFFISSPSSSFPSSASPATSRSPSPADGGLSSPAERRHSSSGDRRQDEHAAVEISKKGQEIAQKDQIIKKKDQLLAEKDESLKNKDRLLEENNESLKEKDQQLKNKDQLLAKKDESLKNKDRLLEENNESLKEKDRLLVEKDESLKEKDQLLAENNESLKEKDRLLAENNESLKEKDRLLVEKDESLKNKDQLLAEKEEELSRRKSKLVMREMLLVDKDVSLRELLTRVVPDADFGNPENLDQTVRDLLAAQDTLESINVTEQTPTSH